MNSFAAIYHDGRSTVGRNIEIHCDEQGEIHFRGDGLSLRHVVGDVRFSSRLGNSTRFMYLPDGSKCESNANDEIDALLRFHGAAKAGAWLHRLESRWTWVATAVVFTLAFLWASFEYGIPYLAERMAHALPIELEANLGRNSLEQLDSNFMKATRLTEVKREQVRALFQQLVAGLDLPVQPQLELRRSKTLGANAFALPSGIVIITDEMVALVDNDQQLISVMAHELGHVEHRHIMRSILQNSVTALLAATLLGDVTSITGLAASIPTFLVQQRNSREFEREADRYAVLYLLSQGIPVSHFAQMLEKLNQEHSGSDSKKSNYLSSHPATQERIDALKDIKPRVSISN